MSSANVDIGVVVRLQAALQRAKDTDNLSVSIGITDAKTILTAISYLPPPPSQDFRQMCVDFVNARRLAPLFPAD